MSKMNDYTASFEKYQRECSSKNTNCTLLCNEWLIRTNNLSSGIKTVRNVSFTPLEHRDPINLPIFRSRAFAWF